MKVWEFIDENIKKGKKLHFTLIDPGKQKPSKAGEIAEVSERAGTHAAMVGGSDTVKQEKLDDTIKQIKEWTKLPVILFPSSVRYLSHFADALLYLDPLNSKRVKLRGDVQKEATPIIESWSLESISTAYLIIEPGMRVGKRAKAKLIKRNDKKTIVKWGLHSEIIGYKLFYVEAGSGAKDPIPDGVIKVLKGNITMPLMVGGGIRSAPVAKAKSEAGADIIVTGTTVEEKSKKNPQKLEEHLAKIISAIKE